MQSGKHVPRLAVDTMDSGESRPDRSGRRLLGDLSLLEDPNGVAERIADAHVGAVEVLGGLLGEVGDATRLEGFVEAPGIVRVEDEADEGALGDQLAQLRGRGFVVQRRARFLREISVPRSPGTRTVSQR